MYPKKLFSSSYLHMFFCGLLLTLLYFNKDDNNFNIYITKSGFKCSSFTKAFSSYDINMLYKLNVSETHFESCYYDSNKATHNLKVSEIPGFPFFANTFQKKNYANVFRSLSNWQYTDDIDNIRVNDVKCGDIIFVKQHFINYFFEIYHLSIKSKYILISHESDYPAGYPWHQMYLNHDTIIRWYGQNVVAKHPKLEPIPIGIMPPMNETFDTLYDAIKNDVTPYFKRTTLLYLNFSPKTNQSRSDILSYFKQFFNNNSLNMIIDEEKISWRQYLKNLGNSQFVLSPPGNGIDCFRTWEALAMGAVPIVLKTELQPLYDDMPVMVVRDWTEVTKDRMEAFQNKKLKHYSIGGFPLRPKSWLRYWIDRISQFQSEFKKNSC